MPDRRACLSVREMVLDPDERFFGDEIDLDAPSCAVANDAHTSAEQELEAILRGAGVHVGRLRFGGFARRLARLDDLLYERFGLTNGEAERAHVAGDAAPVGLVSARRHRA